MNMEKSVIDIIRDVRTTIDEIALNDSDFFGGQDMEEADEIIRTKIREAADFVHGNTTYEILDLNDKDTVCSVCFKGNTTSEGNSIEEDGKVFVISRPDDMLRFLYGAMDCWDDLVTETTDAGTEDYVLALDKVVGATPFRPAVAYGGTKYKYLRAKSASNTATLKYIPVCDYDPLNANKDTVKINNRIYSAFIYHLAGLTLLTWGEQRADDMFNLAMTHMGINGRKE